MLIISNKFKIAILTYRNDTISETKRDCMQNLIIKVIVYLEMLKNSRI